MLTETIAVLIFVCHILCMCVDDIKSLFIIISVCVFSEDLD